MPRKFGQHFLSDQSHLRRIAEAACGAHSDRLIEIGPGRGALTRHLLERTGELHAIEIDKELCAGLEQEFGGRPNFHLHQGDVLETDLSQWGPAVITGNLPYYITSPIIGRFLRLNLNFHHAVFLIQEEVAERLRAGPGSRDYGFLSVQAQLLCDVHLVARVPPGAFAPPPKINSAVVQLDKRRAMDNEMEKLVRFAGWCFAQKRKTLRNNLKPYYPAALIDKMPEAGLRAEQLSISQLTMLAARLSSAEPAASGAPGPSGTSHL